MSLSFAGPVDQAWKVPSIWSKCKNCRRRDAALPKNGVRFMGNVWKMVIKCWSTNINSGILHGIRRYSDQKFIPDTVAGHGNWPGILSNSEPFGRLMVLLFLLRRWNVWISCGKQIGSTWPLLSLLQGRLSHHWRPCTLLTWVCYVNCLFPDRRGVFELSQWERLLSWFF